MDKLKLSIILFFITVLTTSTAFSAVTLEDSHFAGFRQYTCGYVNAKWVPGVKSGNTFETFKEISAQYRTQASQNRRNRRLRAYYIKLAQRTEAKHRASNKGCSRLRAPANTATTTLAKLPEISSLVAANPSASALQTLAVVGTPPVLTSIGSLGAKNIFWNEGVIDAIKNNTANPTQCSQFFSSNVEGQSAGFGGCYMSQSVLENLGEAINSGNTLCYMKNIAAPENISNGSLSVSLGSLPSGGVSSLFAPPSGSTSRVVGLRIEGDGEESSVRADTYGTFIRVYSNGEMAALSDSYRYDFWSCDSSELQEVQQARINRSGTYSIRSDSTSSEGNINFSINARVLFGSDGSISFDPSRNRTIDIVSAGSTYNNKLQATISPDNILSAKFFQSHTSDTRYGVSMANISGSGFTTLRFLSGAFKDKFFRSGTLQTTNLAGMEYRTSNYVAAPSIPSLTTISAINIDSDPYFTSPTIEPLPSGFNCGVTPDIGITIDFSNPALVAIQNICEGGRVDNANFCFSDNDVNSAQNNYSTSCPL